MPEATNAAVVEELAYRLGMHWAVSAKGNAYNDWQVAILSHYPILSTHVHTYPDIFTRRHLLEAYIETPDLGPITVFVFHATSDFQHGRIANTVRRTEIEKILHIMSEKRGTPHILLGDFNSIAPGDQLKTHILFRHVLKEQKKYYDKLKVQYPDYLLDKSKRAKRRRRLTRYVMLLTVSNPFFCALLDIISRNFVQGGIDLLQQAGYVDSFRRIHPRSRGFTCLAAAPAGRIDFIFASPELAHHLHDCDIVTCGGGVFAEQASDHLPVLAEFDHKLLGE
jgi:endonuclease/exonuclease/phosphatase family metal-dependent hydrolase